MKLLMLAAAILISSAALRPQIVGQADPGSVKNIMTAPLHGVRGGARLAALNIERGVSYPSVIHLKGKVEIRANGFILRADEADYDESTGEVDARGIVKVTPYPPFDPKFEK
jgi:lipopolysaccharide assembly outer membrane protein LptD (OstA)